MNERSINAGSGAIPRRLRTMVDGIRTLIKNEVLHRWIAQAFLSKNRISLPIVVERDETLEDILRQVFDTLDPKDQARFRAAISQTVDDPNASEKFWPPESVSEAHALRDLLRLARLSKHYGLLSWAGDELVRLLAQTKTPTDLKTLGEVAALIVDAQNWIPKSLERGPDYRSILRTLYELFERLGDRKRLSFLDSIFLLPAVSYNPDKWPALICAAIGRYDIRGEGLIPDDSLMFGGATYPEGAGLYDLRLCIDRIFKEHLTMTQIGIGAKELVENANAGDQASAALIEILYQRDMLCDLYDYSPSIPRAVNPRGSDMQLDRLFFFGPEFILAVNQGLFRYITGGALEGWLKSSWPFPTLPFDQFVGNLPIWHPLAILSGTIRRESPNHQTANGGPRSFAEFKKRGAAAAIISSSMH